MNRLNIFKNILEDMISGQTNVKIIILVIELPSGALEVITNSENLIDKMQYIINTYDDRLHMKSNQDIRIADYIIY